MDLEGTWQGLDDMIVYLMATICACALAWIGQRSRRSWPWYVAAALPLTLVAAIRWGVGTDLDFTYLPVFRALQWHRGGGGDQLACQLFQPLKDGLVHRPLLNPPLEEAEHWYAILGTLEPGYRGLLELVVEFGGGFQWVTALTSVVTAAFLFTAIYRQSRAPALAIYFYVATSNYFLSLNIVRQYLAIAVILLSLTFALERRFWSFSFCILAAALFHKTAILAFPCYLLPRLQVCPYWGIFVIGLALPCSLVAEPLFRQIMPCLGFGHYVRYFDRPREGFEWLFFAINLCFVLMGIWYWDRGRRSCRLFATWWWMTVLGSVALSFSGVVPLMKRINYYFAAPQFLLLPEMLLAEENVRSRRVLTALVVVAFALETCIAVAVLNKNEPLPYRVWCCVEGAM